MNMRKELSLLGLAAKAGKIVSGEFATENAVKAGKAFLVLTAEDASDTVSYTHLIKVPLPCKDTRVWEKWTQSNSGKLP